MNEGYLDINEEGMMGIHGYGGGISEAGSLAISDDWPGQ